MKLQSIPQVKVCTILQIKQSHMRDSLKYVWKGNLYPIALDNFYDKYKREHGL